jgi:predicted RNA-binding Zn-ribbon protein involved in translation (DUF1610 family)
VTTIIIPESLSPPKCSSCGERLAAWLEMEINSGAIHALCTKCSEPGIGKVKTARLGEFAVLTRAME